jgi:hypothetical protein
MVTSRQRLYLRRLKRMRDALTDTAWSWAERGAILVGLSWLLLRARKDSAPIPQQSSRDIQRLPDLSDHP